MHMAAENGHSKVVSLLLEYKALVNSRDNVSYVTRIMSALRIKQYLMLCYNYIIKLYIGPFNSSSICLLWRT